MRVHNSLGQVMGTMAAFAVAACLLEADGLAHWATHLEIGPLRMVAVPATEAWSRFLKPTGLFVLRENALDTLARTGWSDDAARVAAVADAGKKMTGEVAKEATPLVIVGADAELASQTPRVTELKPLAAVETGTTRVVALAGDSMMAVGLSPELLRETAENPRLRLLKAFRSGTGLARPEVFDWSKEYPALLGGEKPDVVLVAMGANDGQGFVVDGKVLAFGSEEWKRVYEQRVAAYLAMVRAGGAQVVWIGLPPMRSESYDEKMAVINQIAYSVVRTVPGAEWWNSGALVGDDAGHYREFGENSKGGTVKLRQGDGIHLSDEGAALLSRVLVRWMDPVPVAAAAPIAQPAVAVVKPAVVERPVVKARGERVAKGKKRRGR